MVCQYYCDLPVIPSFEYYKGPSPSLVPSQVAYMTCPSVRHQGCCATRLKLRGGAFLGTPVCSQFSLVSCKQAA
eukprot:14103413-Ditylum_brightwellii.AAC.1